MKEIGEKLREARESMGISIDEVAEDLKLRTSQIENIEDGNIEAFQDIFYLKYFIRDYSKYLGLNYEDMVDDFNEYLFDYTSQISLEDIKKAKKENKHNKKEDENKVSSPYTKEYKKKGLPTWLIYILALLLIFGIMTLVYFLILNNI